MSTVIDTVFILSGGFGTRLWPASTRTTPKQFLRVNSDKSLLELTLERAARLTQGGEICIITLAEQLEATAWACADSPVDNDRIVLIPEPFARNTAPAITIAARWLDVSGRREESLLVLAADHLIEPFDAFTSDAADAAALSERGDLVTFGVVPTRPETGYGYIEAGEERGPGFRVSAFKEKPDGATAREYLSAGNYFWNSGMFAFTAGRFLDELSQTEPSVYEAFLPITAVGSVRRLSGIRVIFEDETVRSAYDAAPKISVDYAVMEKSSRVSMIPASFRWNDVGSWDEYATIAEGGYADSKESHDASGTTDHFFVNSTRTYVLSDMPVALCGVEDLIVVQKNGKLLVCKRGESQSVKDLVGEIERSDRSDLLE